MVVMVNTFFLSIFLFISVSPLPGIASQWLASTQPTTLSRGGYGPIRAWFKLLGKAWKCTGKRELAEITCGMAGN
jgi:hypothetical protein